MGNIKYTHINLNKHRNTRLLTAGNIGFPIPLRAPPNTSFIPQIKYVPETITIFCREYSTTASDDVIR